MEESAKCQRAIIFFLWKEGAKSAEIVRRLEAVFGSAADSQATVYRWVNRFRDGRESLEDDPRSGCPATSVYDATVRLVEDIVLEDRHVTYQEIEDRLGIAAPQVHKILHDRLQLNKVAARWVPCLLGPEQKRNRIDACQELLRLEQSYGEDFWNRLITVDETWLPFYNPKTKAQSMEWRRRGEPPPIKAKIVPGAGKVMITVFWDIEGIILVDYLPKGDTITAKSYSDLLKDH